MTTNRTVTHYEYKKEGRLSVTFSVLEGSEKVTVNDQNNKPFDVHITGARDRVKDLQSKGWARIK